MIHQDKKALCFTSAEQLRQDPKSGAYIKMWQETDQLTF